MYFLFETSGCTILSHRIKSIILRVFFFFTFRAQSYDRKYFQKTLILDFWGHFLPELHFFRFYSPLLTSNTKSFYVMKSILNFIQILWHVIMSSTKIEYFQVERSKMIFNFEKYILWCSFKYIHIICWLLAKTCTNILVPNFFLSLLKSIRI